MKQKQMVYILFIIVFVVIIYLLYAFYFKNTYYSDYLCIGAGVSNAYLCYELNKRNIYRGTVMVLEKSERFGGRIKSEYTNMLIQNKPEVGYDELGAMRLFDIPQMKKIFDLLKEFGLKTIKVSLEDSENIFYYNGQQYLKKEAVLSNGIKVSEFEEYMTTNIKNAYPGIDFNDIFDYEEFRDMNIKQLFSKYGQANKEDIKMWIAYSGYDYNLDNTQISTWLYEKNFYNTVDKEKQYYVVDGMIAFVKKLFEQSNAEIIYDTKAISVEKDKEGYNIVNTINSKYGYKQYKCKYLFIGVTSSQFQGLNTFQQIPINPLRLRLAYESVSIPLFKVFFKWDKENVWWGKEKYKTGKSTTDLIIRQVHYYNDEDILVYNTGHYATELYYRFLDNPEKASMEVYRQIITVHGMDIPPPNFAYTTFKYWPDGASKWFLGADVNKNVELIPNGTIDNSNIYIVGDSFSKYQGWIIGGMNSVDIALKSFRT
jgi:monoamine oxidase